MAFDVDALRKKYALERDRRLRPDGIAQYVEIAGPFAGFADDPWGDPHFTAHTVGRRGRRRDHRRRFRRTAHRGTAARTRRAEHPTDRQGRRRRRHLVLEPLPGHRVRRRVVRVHAAARGTGLRPDREIRQGRRDLRALPAHRRALRPLPRRLPSDRGSRDPLGLSASRWIITTNRGDAIRARFVSMANGYLQKPKLPGIPGITDFRGHTFHTSRWDYDYTGADLAKLADKRVGIIGTGATAIQCVPHLARRRNSCSSFSARRRPSTSARNRPTDPHWVGRPRSRLAAPPHRELPVAHRRR